MEEELEPDGSLLLILKCAVLGESAIPKEVNLVEVETKDYTGEIKKWTIFNLSLDSNPMSIINLDFRHETKFQLISGSGPVHITGEMIIDHLQEDENELIAMAGTTNDSVNKNEDSDEDEEEEEDEDEEVSSEGEATKVPKGKKGSINQKSLKKNKLTTKTDKRKIVEMDEDERKVGAKKTGSTKKLKETKVGLKKNKKDVKKK